MILHSVKVDMREPKADEIAQLLRDRGITAVVARLPNNGGGDFCWIIEPETDGQPWLSVTLERKTIEDLLTSANDGRLAAFTATPSTDIALRALVLHGDVNNYRPFGKQEHTAESIDNLLASVQTDGIIVLRAAPGLDALADRILSFWKWTGKDDHGSYRRPALPLTEQVYFSPKERDAVRNLMTIPSMGEQRARDVYRALGLRTVYECLLSGDVAPLLAVHGVGKGVVNAARHFISE